MSSGRRVLIASADRLMQESLPHLLGNAGWDVVAVVADGVAAMAVVGRTEVDSVLIVNGSGRPSPQKLARELRRQWPGLNVVVVGESAGNGSLPADATAEVVLRALEAPSMEHERIARAETPRWIEQLASLTPRERSILKLLGAGLTMEQVAGRLELSDHTVRTHMQKLYAKLGCHSRLDVIRFARQHGLVDGSP